MFFNLGFVVFVFMMMDVLFDVNRDFFNIHVMNGVELDGHMDDIFFTEKS